MNWPHSYSLASSSLETPSLTHLAEHLQLSHQTYISKVPTITFSYLRYSTSNLDSLFTGHVADATESNQFEVFVVALYFIGLQAVAPIMHISAGYNYVLLRLSLTLTTTA
jgi:hypothetical protein